MIPWRPTLEQRRKIDDLLSKLTPEVEAAFRKAIARAAAQIDVQQFIGLLEQGRYEEAAQLAKITRTALFPLDAALNGGFVGGGSEVVAAALPRSIAGAFGFDGRHYRAEAWVREHVGGLIQGIEAESLDLARLVIRTGIADGRSSKAVARDIVGLVSRATGQRQGGFLGLTAQQADSIIAGRQKLYSGDPALMREYLTLKLRNQLFDPLIKRAIKEGRRLTVDELEKVIRAHQSRALAYRGSLIAKTESHSALSAGQYEGFRQLIDSGKVDAVTKRWQHNLSVEPRLDHVALGQDPAIPFDRDFVMGDGTRMAFPHDPRGGAAHSLNCRCVAIYRVVVGKD